MSSMVACNLCGRLRYTTKTSAPEGQLRCRDCRRIAPLKRVVEPVPCAYCGKLFVPQPRSRSSAARSGGLWTTHCSRRCGERHRRGVPVNAGPDWRFQKRRTAAKLPTRRRRQRHAETYDGVIDWQIWERDRWRCHICRRKISPKLRYPDPKSASVDHLVPLSQGGSDTAANKRAAHLWCNMSRGNRGGNEQLMLVG